MLHRRELLTSAFGAMAAAALPEAAFGKPAPFKLFDTHAHFYSDTPEKYPFRADISLANSARVKAHPMTAEAVFKMWKDAGVERGCGVQYNSAYLTDNRYLLDISDKYPRKIYPIVILSPTDAATPATLARMAKENHISGVRFTGPPNDAGVFPYLSDAAKGAWEVANDLGLVIVLMPTRAQTPMHASLRDGFEKMPVAMARTAEFADRYPNVNIVLDHLGFPVPEASPTFGLSPEHLALAGHKNVYYKYTTYLMEILEKSSVSSKTFLEYAVGVYGADHFVWGSDVGNTEGDITTLVQHALASAEGLTLDQRKALFYTTARKIFVPGGHGRAR
jgi:predicted TIM-barrel fold metal-dependent hydrolase